MLTAFSLYHILAYRRFHKNVLLLDRAENLYYLSLAECRARCLAHRTHNNSALCCLQRNIRTKKKKCQILAWYTSVSRSLPRPSTRHTHTYTQQHNLVHYKKRTTQWKKTIKIERNISARDNPAYKHCSQCWHIKSIIALNCLLKILKGKFIYKSHVKQNCASSVDFFKKIIKECKRKQNKNLSATLVFLLKEIWLVVICVD